MCGCLVGEGPVLLFLLIYWDSVSGHILVAFETPGVNGPLPMAGDAGTVSVCSCQGQVFGRREFRVSARFQFSGTIA